MREIDAGLRRANQRHQYKLEQKLIELPAQKSEVQLEDQLTQRILDDVGQEPGNLPLL